VLIAAKTQRYLLNQNQTGQCIVENVFQNIALAVKDFKLNLFKVI